MFLYLIFGGGFKNNHTKPLISTLLSFYVSYIIIVKMMHLEYQPLGVYK